MVTIRHYEIAAGLATADLVDRRLPSPAVDEAIKLLTGSDIDEVASVDLAQV